MLVILATRKVDVKGPWSKASLNINERLYLKNTKSKKDWGWGSNCTGPDFNPLPCPKKEINKKQNKPKQKFLRDFAG
jgi:hypothetical protein